MNPARYIVVQESFLGDGPVVIRDVGPWDRHATVTNDAEAVVEDLVRTGRLGPNGRLLYFDSDGQLDAILVKDGRFAGFVPATASDRREAGIPT